MSVLRCYLCRAHGSHVMEVLMKAGPIDLCYDCWAEITLGWDEGLVGSPLAFTLIQEEEEHGRQMDMFDA